MLKILPILLLVALVNCQSNEDLIAMLGQIYGPTEPFVTNQVKTQGRNPTVPPIQTGSTLDEISPNPPLQSVSKTQGRNPIVPPIQTGSTWAEISPNRPLQHLSETQGRNPIVPPTQTGSNGDEIPPNRPLQNLSKTQGRNPIVPPIQTGSTWDEIPPNRPLQRLSNPGQREVITNQIKTQGRNPIVPPIQTGSTWDEISPNRPLQSLSKTQGRNPIVPPIQTGSTRDEITRNRPLQSLSKTQGRNPIVPPIQTGSTWDEIATDRPLQRLSNPGQREGCGWANPNGVDLQNSSTNDEYAKFGEIPWMVAILKVEPLDDGPKGNRIMIYIGGGSLIHPSVVLTVAHCVTSGKTLKVRAGEWDTQRTTEIYPFQERDVTSVAIHKDFIKQNSFYDIAVLFLNKPMELAPNVGVACLPPARIFQRENTRCIATGWGKDKFNREGRYQVILKKIELPVVNRDDCQAALRRTRLGNNFQLHSSFMCAGGELGKDTCTGDGGAPLSCPIADEQDRYVQSGIVAWGVGCGDDGTPGVYVDVSVLRDWIDDKVAGKGYDPRTYSY